MKTRTLAAIIAASLAFVTHADAKPKHHRVKHVAVAAHVIVCNQQGCSDAPGSGGGGERVKAVRYSRTDSNGNTEIIGGRPEGCPHRYCGCGLRKYLGIADKRLDLAWNWAKLFPREPGPRAGLAAVRHGHVMYIEASAGDGQWLIRDYNSGGGLSRLHVVSVRGFVFVNPHQRIASR